MSWYELEDDQVDALINVLYLVIVCCAAISFYLYNPYWQGTMLGLILGSTFYHGFLYNKHKYKQIELRAKVKADEESRETIRKLERELDQLKIV